MNIIDVGALLAEVVAALERDHQLRDRLLAVLQPPQVEPQQVEPEALFLRVGQFAQRMNYSKSFIESMVREGLPLIGRGHSRRVPVAAAEAWLRARGDAHAAELGRRHAARAVALRAARSVR